MHLLGYLLEHVEEVDHLRLQNSPGVLKSAFRTLDWLGLFVLRLRIIIGS